MVGLDGLRPQIYGVLPSAFQVPAATALRRRRRGS